MNEKLPDTQCTCDTCVQMCKGCPCWPTPQEAKAIIDAGFGNRLMLDWWHEEGGNIEFLSPAIVGFESGRAAFWPQGDCTFLQNDRCMLHDRGLKPIEGRKAHHAADQDEMRRLHESIPQLWNNDEARALLVQWKLSYY